MDVLLAAAESLRSAEINEFHRRAGKIQKVHVKRKRGVFKCDKCPSVFGLRHNLLRHERTIHQGRRPFKCDQPACAASFVQRFDLETHRASVHHKRKDHRCTTCARSFSQRSNLLTHVRVSHHAAPDDAVASPLVPDAAGDARARPQHAESVLAKDETTASVLQEGESLTERQRGELVDGSPPIIDR